MENIERVMAMVEDRDGDEKNALIQDLLIMLPSDVVDNVEWCLENDVPLGTDL